MSEWLEGEPVPADVLFDSICDWKPGTISAEQLVGSVESKIGRPIVGQERTDLLSLAESELAHDNEQFGKDEE